MVAVGGRSDYIAGAGLRGASGVIFLGALSILKGAVPDRARGSGHMAPTYMCREPGIATPTAIAAPHCWVCLFRVKGPYDHFIIGSAEAGRHEAILAA